MQLWGFFKQGRASEKSYNYEQDSLVRAAQSSSEALKQRSRDDGEPINSDRDQHDIEASHNSSQQAQHLNQSHLAKEDSVIDRSSEQDLEITAEVHQNFEDESSLVTESVAITTGQKMNQEVASCIIVVDAGYSKHEETVKMMEGLGSMLVVQASKDPLRQIEDEMQRHRPVASLHIFAKVAPGRLFLAGEEIEIQSLTSKQEQRFRTWRKYFTKQGVVYLYDDAFSRGEEGQKSLEILREICNLQVTVPGSDVGVYIQVAEDINEWIDDTQSIGQDDLLARLESGKNEEKDLCYTPGTLKRISLSLDQNLIDIPLLIVELQISEGVLFLAENKLINHLQHAKVGARLIFKGDTLSIHEALSQVIFISNASHGVFIRMSVKNLEHIRLSDSVIPIKAMLTADDANEKHLFSLESPVVLSRDTPLILCLRAPSDRPWKVEGLRELRFLEKNSGKTIKFVLDESNHNLLRYRGSAQYLEPGLIRLEPSQTSQKIIEEALGYENMDTSCTTEVLAIVDYQETYSPQLAEEKWLEIKAPHKILAAGDILDINIQFCDPIAVRGAPKLLLTADNRTLVAHYAGWQGCIVDQRLRFQACVECEDIALSGITLQGLSEDSSSLITGCHGLDQEGLPVDRGVIPSRRWSKVRIMDHRLHSMSHCQVHSQRYHRDDLAGALVDWDKDDQLCPMLDLDDPWLCSVASPHLCVIVRSWSKTMAIHAILHLRRDEEYNWTYGLNDWQEANYRAIDPRDPDYRGFSLDVFLLSYRPILQGGQSLEEMAAEMRGSLISVGQFLEDHSASNKKDVLEEMMAFKHALKLIDPQEAKMKKNGVTQKETSIRKDTYQKAKEPVSHRRAIIQYKSLIMPENAL